jgi:deoxycytidine triphosphate deaminase
MILSGNDIVKYGIVSDVETNAIQPNSIDLKLTGVYYPVTKEIGKKLSEEDFHEVDKFVIKDISAWRSSKKTSTNYYHLDYDTKYLFGVQKINLSPRLLPTTTIENDQLCATYEKKYFTAEIKPKSSWSRRGWTMSPNHFDSGFAGDGAVIIRTPQHQDGMPSQITVNTDMYFAQLVVSDAYPTENYNGQYQGSKF